MLGEFVLISTVGRCIRIHFLNKGHIYKGFVVSGTMSIISDATSCLLQKFESLPLNSQYCYFQILKILITKLI